MHSSSKNLGVGDRAVIINALCIENIGKEIFIEKISDEAVLELPVCCGSTYNDKRNVCALISGNVLLVQHDLFGKIETEFGWIPLQNIMPLKGDFKEEEEVEDVLLSLSHN